MSTTHLRIIALSALLVAALAGCSHSDRDGADDHYDKLVRARDYENDVRVHGDRYSRPGEKAQPKSVEKDPSR